MIEIANLEEWTKEYFSDPENQKKAEKENLLIKFLLRLLLIL